MVFWPAEIFFLRQNTWSFESHEWHFCVPLSNYKKYNFHYEWISLICENIIWSLIIKTIVAIFYLVTWLVSSLKSCSQYSSSFIDPVSVIPLKDEKKFFAPTNRELLPLSDSRLEVEMFPRDCCRPPVWFVPAPTKQNQGRYADYHHIWIQGYNITYSYMI